MSDALEELERLAPSIAAGINARKLQSSLGRAADKLLDVPRRAKRFEALVDTAMALGANADANAQRSLKQAAEEADELGEMLQNARGPEDLQYAMEELPKLSQALQRLDAVVRQLWRGLVATDFLSLVAVGALLTRIERTRDLGERLAAVGRQALALADRNSAAELLAPEIKELRERRTALDAELQQVTGNPEVDAFLAAVTRDGATLAHVTPAVAEWLKRNEALDVFAVRGSA